MSGKGEKRGAKTSITQLKIYLKYLKENNVLRTGKLTPAMDPTFVNNIYKKMTSEMNACGIGPQKSVEGWKKVKILYNIYAYL